MNVTTLRLLRGAGAVGLLLGGAVHLQQWLRVFRHQDIGPLFIINVVASVVVGAALLVSDDRRIATLGILISIGSLIAIILSRTTGLLGFEATDYGTPEIEAIVLEVITSIVLSAWLLLARPAARGATEKGRVRSG